MVPGCDLIVKTGQMWTDFDASPTAVCDIVRPPWPAFPASPQKPPRVISPLAGLRTTHGPTLQAPQHPVRHRRRLGHGHAGAYGCKWVKTPNFDRVAREGVLFTNAFTSNPKCSPCRATILTGRNTWQLKEADQSLQHLPQRVRRLSRAAREGRLLRRPDRQGLGAGRFQVHRVRRTIPPDRASTRHRQAAATGDLAATTTPATSRTSCQQKPTDKPFCFWLGGHEPHRAYEPGSGIRAGKKLADVGLPTYFPDTRIIRSDLLDYAVEVEWFDQHLGRALKKLEETGELDNTLVVVTSDHGMPFPRVKGQIYEDGFHIPLAMRWGKHIQPAAASSTTSSTPATSPPPSWNWPASSRRRP